ncbi:MAG: OmpA family protein [Saprospiraceae bacterium]|nr:OmpA family protein [Saprospiraceae bacterium]
MMSRYYFLIAFVLLPLLSKSQSTEEPKLVIMRYDNLPSNLFINKLVVDSKNNIWVASSDGVHLLQGSDKKDSHVYTGKNIIAIHEHNGEMYLATASELYKYPGNENMLKDSEFTLVDFSWVNDVLYLASERGIYQYESNNKSLKALNELNQDLKGNKINFLHGDDHGILWAGTRNGELRIDGDSWKLRHDEENVSLYRENNEGLWFYAQKNMWLVDPWNRGYDVGLDESLSSGKVNDFVLDKKGRLYFASNKLVRYDPYEEEIEAFPSEASLLTKKCTALACDSSNVIWIGSDGSGLYRLIFPDNNSEELFAGILVQKTLSCNDRKDAIIKVSAAGGVPPYIYKWNTSESDKDELKNLGPGTYELTVTDQIGNLTSTSIELLRPEPLVISVEEIERVTADKKNDGKAIISVSGGKPPYDVRWSNGAKGMQVAKLRAGDYTINVQDDNGCTAQETITIPREKFLPELEMSQLQIGKTLRINELNFKADSTAIEDESVAVLSEIYDFLIQNPNVNIEIGGHTNTIPSDAYCDRLSADRARNVAEYFYNRGIPASQISYKGYGKRQPLTKDESLAGRKKNQRVEIKILAM